jgi:arginyl-tRNA synthetase
MRILDIEARVEALKNEALEEMDVPDEAIAEIHVGKPPQPDMGDRGFPCFVLARHLRKAPPVIAGEVAEKVREQLVETDIIEEVRAVGPYVNVVFSRPKLAQTVISEALDDPCFGGQTADAPTHWMVEYSAPNTNKPQHLGHVRNDLLGYAVAQIGDWAGNDVTRVNLINDRGIHICKSMLAYKKWGEGETPDSAGVKGDHLVGKYYVLFNQKFSAEYASSQTTAEDKADYFNRDSELGAEAKAMLRAWEAGDEATVDLWKTMNQWVFDGFDQTYERLGIEFDHVYKESETYKLGKDVVLEGLETGDFEQLDDGAVVCDLEKLGLQGQKVLLRSDGTSVYMTQDIGTAIERFKDYELDQMIYVVGNEQDYHFQVLFKVLGLLKPELAGRLMHLSYGMVDLPDGKMKSREGTVVDADDLMDEMEALAREAVVERWPELAADEADMRARSIGMAALKYYILDFNPRTTVNFDPKKSIDFQGRTGPYCLYSYARIQSIGRKLGGWPDHDDAGRKTCLKALSSDLEMELVRQLQEWPTVAASAAHDLDPSKVTEHMFNLCKSFSTLYNDDAHKIVDIDDEARRDGLLYLSSAVAATLQKGLGLLGIDTLEEM